uniref:Uncharacterized protein n=1 Tax=mine drainage metagenome TaxID=410659 RepID=E6PWJ6_9ZZZZ
MSCRACMSPNGTEGCVPPPPIVATQQSQRPLKPRDGQMLTESPQIPSHSQCKGLNLEFYRFIHHENCFRILITRVSQNESLEHIRVRTRCARSCPDPRRPRAAAGPRLVRSTGVSPPCESAPHAWLHARPIPASIPPPARGGSPSRHGWCCTGHPFLGCASRPSTTLEPRWTLFAPLPPCRKA